MHYAELDVLFEGSPQSCSPEHLLGAGLEDLVQRAAQCGVIEVVGRRIGPEQNRNILQFIELVYPVQRSAAHEDIDEHGEDMRPRRTLALLGVPSYHVIYSFNYAEFPDNLANHGRGSGRVGPD
ncbi:MAG: hypothetical protein BWY92_01635 [Firmicutes bacterium ADurb.BinA052]|nr:MAG: hypothetical protein BWY92_01635 [Firmicutes bacterium ADurb.BinA052]